MATTYICSKSTFQQSVAAVLDHNLNKDLINMVTEYVRGDLLVAVDHRKKEIKILDILGGDNIIIEDNIDVVEPNDNKTVNWKNLYVQNFTIGCIFDKYLIFDYDWKGSQTLVDLTTGHLSFIEGYPALDTKYVPWQNELLSIGTRSISKFSSETLKWSTICNLQERVNSLLTIDQKQHRIFILRQDMCWNVDIYQYWLSDERKIFRRYRKRLPIRLLSVVWVGNWDGFVCSGNYSHMLFFYNPSKVPRCFVDLSTIIKNDQAGKHLSCINNNVLVTHTPNGIMSKFDLLSSRSPQQLFEMLGEKPCIGTVVPIVADRLYS